MCTIIEHIGIGAVNHARTEEEMNWVAERSCIVPLMIDRLCMVVALERIGLALRSILGSNRWNV